MEAPALSALAAPSSSMEAEKSRAVTLHPAFARIMARKAGPVPASSTWRGLPFGSLSIRNVSQALLSGPDSSFLLRLL